MNDAPTLPAAPLPLGTDEDTPLPITKGRLLEGAADVETGASALSINIVERPEAAVGELEGPNASGDYTFKPAANSAAAASFKYTVTDDGDGTDTVAKTSGVRTVDISVGERRARARTRCSQQHTPQIVRVCVRGASRWRRGPR